MFFVVLIFLGYTTRSYAETIHDEVQWMKEEGLIEGDPAAVTMTNAEIRESGAMSEIVKAMDHDMSDVFRHM